MNDKTTSPKPDWWSPEAAERIRKIEYDFDVRAFGEEMARINFLPYEQRMKEIGDMYDFAVSQGVVLDKPAPGYTR